MADKAKEREWEKYKNLNILRKKKLLDKIKSIFLNFLRATIRW